MSKLFPCIALKHAWADEVFGYNTGTRTLQNGKVMDEHLPKDYSDEAYRMAKDILGIELEGPNATYARSAAGTNYVYTDYPPHDIVTIAGQQALFIESRLHTEDIPEGLYHYHVHSSSPALPFGAVSRSGSGDILGTVITKAPIGMSITDILAFTEKKDALFFTAAQATLKEYMNADFQEKALEKPIIPGKTNHKTKSKPTSQGR